VRQREADPRATPAGLEAKFDGPTKISIKRPEGFDAGAIYEFNLHREGSQGDGPRLRRHP